MTDKVQKIREKVEKLKSQLLRGACSLQVAMETRCKEEAYNEVLGILDFMQEEPANEELETEIKKAFLDNECSVTDAVSLSAFTRIARHFAEWGKQHFKCPCDCPAFKDGIKVGRKEMKRQMDEYLKDMSNEIDLIGD